MDLSLVFFFIIIIPSAIVHEYAHAWMADRLGDPTAKQLGRLTLNPIAHIDPIGTLLLPLIMFMSTGGRFLFAYAKPVPFNPYNLKDQKWGPALVGLAGPASNLLLAVVFGLLIRFMPESNFSVFLSIIVYANILLMVFNLVPIPPLDGSKLLYALLPDSLNNLKLWLERFGFVFLLIFIFFFFQWLVPVILYIFQVLTGQWPSF
ncbi:MAG: site-2 protease family protein [bacterium]